MVDTNSNETMTQLWFSLLNKKTTLMTSEELKRHDDEIKSFMVELFSGLYTDVAAIEILQNACNMFKIQN